MGVAIHTSTHTVLTFIFADPAPPTGVSVDVTGCDSAVVTWMPSVSIIDNMIGNYCVKYQLTSDGGGPSTVYTSSTSVTLRGLVPNAEYNLSVAGINSCGSTSAFVMDLIELQGNSRIYSVVMLHMLYLQI